MSAACTRSIHGLFSKGGAVLYWGAQKRDPSLENYPHSPSARLDVLKGSLDLLVLVGLVAFDQLTRRR